MKIVSTDEIIKFDNLAEWMLIHGLAAVSSTQIADATGTPVDQVRQRMARLRRNGSFVSPARGLWVPVPLEYRAWGAPEPLHYIDSLMAHHKVDYCVGWLSAAEFYGASHQAPQVFQLATSRMLRDKLVGRSKLSFSVRIYVTDIDKRRITKSAGRAWVASPEVTALMLTDDLSMSGGINNVATLVVELAEGEYGLDIAGLIEQSQFFPHVALRRVGWLLENYSNYYPVEDIRLHCAHASQSIEILDPSAPRSGSIDSSWNLIINREVEPDL